MEYHLKTSPETTSQNLPFFIFKKTNELKGLTNSFSTFSELFLNSKFYQLKFFNDLAVNLNRYLNGDEDSDDEKW